MPSQAPRQYKQADSVPVSVLSDSYLYLGIDETAAQKLAARGPAALTDTELLQLLLQDTTPAAALRVRQTIASLPRLAAADYRQLLQHDLLPQPQAMAVQAAFELARRKQREESRQLVFPDAAAVAAFVKPLLLDLDHEVCILLLLNRSNELIAEKILSVGGVAGTIIDPKRVFREALLHGASAIIVCHNHPSGSLQPSEADRHITDKLQKGARLLDLELLDHLIISFRGYFSFADEGLL